MKYLTPAILALTLSACASFEKPTIESSIKILRDACALIGHADDLDACAAQFEDAATHYVP